MEMTCNVTFFVHAMPLILMSVSHDAKSTTNGLIPFFGEDEQNAMQHDWFSQVMPLAPISASGGANGIINGTLHLFGQDHQNKVQHWLWCWYYIIPIASKMAPLYSLCKYN